MKIKPIWSRIAITALILIAVASIAWNVQQARQNDRGQANLHRVMQQVEEKSQSGNPYLDVFTEAEPADSSETVYVTRTGECYHRGRCNSLRKSKIETTVTQARQDGFRACSRCRPPEE